MKENNGITLVEFIVAILIFSFMILVFIGNFGNISRALVSSKANTLATNLAQEKIQILRQMPYHRILITPSPSYLTEFSPPVPYDTAYFPPENILEGGMYFTRYTYVYPVQEIDGEIEPIPPTSPDIGLKCIEVSVVYPAAYGKKVARLRTVEANPDITAFRGVIQGRVRDRTTLSSLRDAVVVVAENIGCKDYTDSNGNYSIRLPFGSYSVVASKQGYFTAMQPVSVGVSPQTVNFDLQPMSSGTVFGYAWLNDRIVISQVVGSTVGPNGFVQEYIELYNPTTFYWQMAVSSTQGIIGLKYQSTADANIKEVPLNYYTLSIPPSSYYLIANTTTIVACGVTKTADAVFSTSTGGYTNIIKTADEDGAQYGGGAVGIYYIASGGWIDRVGWDLGTKPAPFYETDGITQYIGLEINEQYVRKVSTWGVVSGWGNAYDSDNNNIDFVEYRKPMRIPPRNSSNSFPPLTGRPAVGSFVSCNDGLSGVVNAFSFGSPPVAYFEVVSVATGSWNVFISSNEKIIEISNVSVVANTKLGIPNANTSPVWYSPYHYSQLINVTEGGFISGRVVNVAGLPINNIRVVVGGSEALTNNDGRYFLSISPGIYSVTANPNNSNPLYIYQTRENVEIKHGVVTSGVNFVLSQGGRVSGFVSRDRINPLPGVVVVAESLQGFVYGDGTSDNTGRFLIPNLSTGTYYIKPVLSLKEKSVPAGSTVTVSAGIEVFAGTFTITGAKGKISGRVFSQSEAIKTGVLIVATTSLISSPPALSTSTLTGVPYFITNSYEDGSYRLEVIGSSTTRYNIYGYYTRYGPCGLPIISTRTLTNILVLPGQEVGNQNLSF